MTEYKDDHCDGDNHNAEDKIRMKLIMTRKLKTPTLL